MLMILNLSMQVLENSPIDFSLKKPRALEKLPSCGQEQLWEMLMLRKRPSDLRLSDVYAMPFFMADAGF
jgi:hypothetical protein